MVQCPKCSAQIPAESKFCLSCGQDIRSLSQMPTAEGTATASPKAPAEPLLKRPLPSAPAVAAQVPAPALALPPEPQTPPATRYTPSATRDEQAGLQAFLSGVGLPPAVVQQVLAQSDSTALLTTLGQLFRQTIEGLREILLARGQIKRDIGAAEITQLRPTENNPLKFSVTTEEALTRLLLPQGPAFLPLPQALAEALTDIKHHELAMFAGMQAALGHLLQRFNPQQLEARIGSSLLNSLLPGSRKARYWDLFTTLYEDIVHEAQDDFRELFGQKFARAYDEHSAARDPADPVLHESTDPPPLVAPRREPKRD